MGTHQMRQTRAVVKAAMGLLTLCSLSASAFGAPGDRVSDASRAARALVQGDANSAVARYSKALRNVTLSNDKRATILNDRGVAYIKLGKPRQAIEDFNTAARLFPEYAPIYNNRGNLLLSLGLYAEAVKDFDRAIVLAPGYAAAYNNRAGALTQLGRHDEAVADYSKAVQLMPLNPAPLSGRGRAHLAKNRPHAAIRDFSRAVTADARFPAGYRNRAAAMLELKRYDEAIEDFSRAIAFDINHAESYVRRGLAYLTSQNIASAIKDFTRALEIRPDNVEALAALGLAYGLSETYDLAFENLNRAIELDPKYGTAFAYRAFIYKQTNQTDVALRDIVLAEKLTPDGPEVHWAKAEVAEAQGDIDGAIAELRKAVKLRPSYRAAHEGLIRLGAGDLTPPETEVEGAGVDVWRVVLRDGRFFAVSDSYPRIDVPLEMMGEGEPQLISWTPKDAPYTGIGVLRYNGGQALSRTGKVDVELIAVVDLNASKVVAIETAKQGKRKASVSWQGDKLRITSIDGVTDEFAVRIMQPRIAGPYGNRGTGGDPYGEWAPWDAPWAGGFNSGQRKVRRARKKKKKKSFFQLLFSN